MSGKAFKFVLGAALIGAAFIPGLGAIAGIGLKALFLSVGSSLAINAISTPSGLQSRQGAVFQNSADTQGPLPVAYGRNKLGLRLVEMRTAGTDNEFLWMVGALCHGSEDGTGIAGIDEIYFNDRLAFDAAGVVQDEFLGLAELGKYVGTDAQDFTTGSLAGQTLGGVFPTQWPSTSKGRGIAGIILRLTWDAEVFATGIPTVTVVVRGQKVKDPRNLVAAAAYSTNPACCIYDYLTSARYGCGCVAGDVNATSLASMATYYDTVVTKNTTLATTGALFTCNGWLDVSQSTTENLRQLCASCRGFLIYEGGQYRLFTRRVVTPTAFTLTEANIVGDFTFHAPGVGEAPNIIRGTYIEPGVAGEGYPFQPETKIWPRPGASNGFLTADNNYEVAQDTELPFTADPYSAEQILLVTLKEQRAGLTVGLTATEAALVLQVGDLVPVTHTTPGWVAKNFWVMGSFLDPQTKLIRLALLEYDSAAYTLDALSTIPTPPSTTLPNPFTVPPPGDLELSASDAEAQPDADGTHRVYIRVTWPPAPITYLDYYEVQYRQQGVELFGPAPDHNRTDTEALIGPVTEGVGYDIRVRAVNTLGRSSEWIEGSINPHFEGLHRSGSFWIDDFTSQTPGRRWVDIPPLTTGLFLDAYDPDSVVGGKVGRCTGPVSMELKDNIPFDQGLLYIIRWRVRQLRASVVGPNSFSLGLSGVAQFPGQPGNFNWVNTAGQDTPDNQHMVCASGQTLTPSRQWTDYFAYVKGYAGGTYPLTAAMLSHSGLGSFSAANLTDGDTTESQVGFSTDSAVAGARLIIDFGAANEQHVTEVRFHMGAAGSVAEWDLEFSDDASTWTTAS